VYSPHARGARGARGAGRPALVNPLRRAGASGWDGCATKGDTVSGSIPDKPSQAEGDIGDDDITAAEQESEQDQDD
jgi:hypothetical protein